MHICKECGRETKYDNFGEYCPACYRYFVILRRKRYPIPPDGILASNKEGHYICHECGTAYKSLPRHIANLHGMTTKEYREKHDLARNCVLSSKKTVEIAREFAKNPKFIESRHKAKKGESVGKGIKRRLQTRLRCGNSKAYEELKESYERGIE